MFSVAVASPAYPYSVPKSLRVPFRAGVLDDESFRDVPPSQMNYSEVTFSEQHFVLVTQLTQLDQLIQFTHITRNRYIARRPSEGIF